MIWLVVLIAIVFLIGTFSLLIDSIIEYQSKSRARSIPEYKETKTTKGSGDIIISINLLDDNQSLSIL